MANFVIYIDLVINVKIIYVYDIQYSYKSKAFSVYISDVCQLLGYCKNSVVCEFISAYKGKKGEKCG